jgi:hypothetical protein
MAQARRTTVHLHPSVHRALRVKARRSHTTLSALINEALRDSFVQDAADVAAFRARAKERTISFETFVVNLERARNIR